MSDLWIPNWPTKGFMQYCMSEIRDGLTMRYWIFLPSNYRKELAFRKELTEMINSTRKQIGTPAYMLGDDEDR